MKQDSMAATSYCCPQATATVLTTSFYPPVLQTTFLSRRKWRCCTTLPFICMMAPSTSIPRLAGLRMFFFHKQNISSSSLEGNTLSEYFEKYNDIFLKMDIEGHEFEWFDSLSAADLLKIKQLVIEIHMTEHPAEQMQKQRRTLARLAYTHVLLHAHGNNCRNVPWLADHVCPRGNSMLSLIPIFAHCASPQKVFRMARHTASPSAKSRHKIHLCCAPQPHLLTRLSHLAGAPNDGADILPTQRCWRRESA